MRDGFIAIINSDGRVSYSQYKNGKRHGYGIFTDYDGRIYRGQLKHMFPNGYGHAKYANNDEYDGEWVNNRYHGVGVFKDASTVRIERRLYENGHIQEVLEVIQEG